MSAFSVTLDSLPRQDFSGKTVFITGGSSGIGLATAKLFASLHSNIVVFDRTLPPQEELPQSPTVVFIQGDLLSWTSLCSAFDKAVSQFGSIDIVFANAGITEKDNFFFSDKKDENGELAEPDHQVVDIDLKATANTVKLAIYHLRQNGKGGSIICTASLAGYLATTGLPMYSAAKHGLVGLIRALKHETARHNIAISIIAPAITTTPLMQESFDIANKSKTPVNVQIMRKGGVPLNDPGTVALGAAYLAGLKSKANGLGILCQNDRMAELEGGLVRTRQEWMGEEMLGYFRGGRGVKSSKI